VKNNRRTAAAAMPFGNLTLGHWHWSFLFGVVRAEFGGFEGHMFGAKLEGENIANALGWERFLCVDRVGRIFIFLSLSSNVPL
jgi:hypothetical protein